MSKAGALAARPTDKEAEKGRVEQARVRRYWAGKAPEWAHEQQLQELQISDRDVVRTEVAAPVIVRKADPRLARLAASRSEDVEEVRERHREIRAAEVVRRRRSGTEDEEEASQESEEEEQEQEAPRRRAPSSGGEGPQLRGLPGRGQEDQQDEEGEEELLRRRQAVRERLLQQQREAEAAQQQAQQEEEEEEEESSEYETDSEDEAEGRRLLKPVFVPKQARETIAEREKLEAEEEALREYDKKREQERKAETREILKATVEAEEAQARAAAEEVHKSTVADWRDINTDDDEADEEAEFAAWKTRETARIRRSREEKERQEAEAAERERLKNMTEEERRAWEAANPKQANIKEKQKWRFLQKYWHKGAFFQEDADDTRGTVGKDSIFARDYSAPTGEDKFNKELLPKIMQVKNFGRSGRTKWTHLLNEDTTQVAAPLAQASADRKRFAGSGAEEFAKPKKFRT